MSRYEEYKDSCTTWMGQVPSHWKLERAKWHFTSRNERGNDTPVLLAATQKYGMYPQDMVEGVVKVAEGTDVQQFRTVHKGDFVISLRSFQGGFERSDYEGVCSPAYQVFYADDSWNNDYLKYLFKNELFIDAMNALTVGIREGRNIKYEDFANSVLAIPPLAEQANIAKYLDRETERIDAIIAEAKASIEEYKEWKASIIYEAVTKGLDCHVAMKDSGIDWLGQIPAHWIVTKIKTVCRLKTGSTPATSNPEWFNGDIPWFTPGDFNERYYLSSSSRSLSQKAKDDNMTVNIPANTVLIVGIGATAGKIGFTLVEGSCNQQITALITSKIDSRYLMYWMIANTKFIRETAMFTTLPILNNQTIGNYPIVVPYESLEEQRQIADYLDIQSSRIEELIMEKYALIEDLEVYKKSIIFEVVTGKRKVV